MPGLDPLEDRHLLSGFGGPSAFDTGHAGPIEIVRMGGGVPKDLGYTPGPFATTHDPFASLPGGMGGEHHFGPGGPSAWSGHSEISALPTYPPPFYGLGAKEAHAVQVFVAGWGRPVDAALSSGLSTVSPVQPAAADLARSGDVSTPVVMNAGTFADRFAAVLPGPGPRVGPIERPYGPMGGPASVSAAVDLALAAVAAGDAAPAPAGAPAGPESSHAEAAATPEVAAAGRSIYVAPASPSAAWPAPDRSPGPAARPGPRGPQAEPTPPPAGPIASEPATEPVSEAETQAPAEVPPPRGADLIAEVLLDGSPLEESFAWLVDRFDGLDRPLEPPTGAGIPYVVPVAAGLATLEAVRRWRTRRLDAVPARSWKARSSTLYGFF